jgi:hypothetical protein
VNTDHQMPAMASILRGPKRRVSRPPGTWNSAYAHQNEVSTMDSWVTEKSNCLAMTGATTVIAVRSMLITKVTGSSKPPAMSQRVRPVATRSCVATMPTVGAPVMTGRWGRVRR